LSANVTPPGSAPLSVKLGVGTPVVVTVNVPSVLYVIVAVLALVMAGAAPRFTVGSEPGFVGSVQARGNELVEAASE
jgi:hypothetical protein